MTDGAAHRCVEGCTQRAFGPQSVSVPQLSAYVQTLPEHVASEEQLAVAAQAAPSGADTAHTPWMQRSDGPHATSFWQAAPATAVAAHVPSTQRAPFAHTSWQASPIAGSGRHFAPGPSQRPSPPAQNGNAHASPIADVSWTRPTQPSTAEGGR
jgi:hypothetical protein